MCAAIEVASADEDDDIDEEDVVHGTWREFETYLHSRGLGVQPEKPNSTNGLRQQLVGFLWETPRGWSVGQVYAKASQYDQARGFTYDVQYGETTYPQKLDLAEYALGDDAVPGAWVLRSEEHTSELQSLMRISYAFFCLKK